MWIIFRLVYIRLYTYLFRGRPINDVTHLEGRGQTFVTMCDEGEGFGECDVTLKKYYNKLRH